MNEQSQQGAVDPREQNPYPGLRPYEENEQDQFFGRDADTQILLDKILTHRLTLLFAATGVGKSSLLKAAVIPRLKSASGKHLDVVYYNDWLTAPLAGLKSEIVNTVQQSANWPKGTQIDETQSLTEFVQFCTLFVRSPLVIVLDQFEELFRYRYKYHTDTFDPFINGLTELITATRIPVSVVFSMREDYAMELNAFKSSLPTLLFENYYRLERLSLRSAKEAIVAPLKSTGFQYELKLLSELLEDLSIREREGAEAFSLEEIAYQETIEPSYLQIICARLWELNKGNKNNKITLLSYIKAGRDNGILSHFLSLLLSKFSFLEKKIASRSFDFLASHRGVKVAYPLAVLANITGVKKKLLQPVLEKLARADVRILRTQERAGVTWYELYHDMFSISVEYWNDDWKAKQKRKLRWIIGAGVISLFASIALLVDSFLWVKGNYFPVSHLFQRQKFHLMNLGLLKEPLPEMIEIPLPKGNIGHGEYNQEFSQEANARLTNEGSYSRQNFGSPVVSVKIAQPFSLGKFEITYEQYDYYVWQQRKLGVLKNTVDYLPGAPRNNGRGDIAVTQVLGNEALLYTQWLSRKTGDSYRLPTEAEWEYAAKGGTITAYWSGEHLASVKANCQNCGSWWDGRFIAPVGEFHANPFGLHDTAGNVWELTCSKWTSEIKIEFVSSCINDAKVYVIRGGGWKSDISWLRSSARNRSNPNYRHSAVGFRVYRQDKDRL